MGLRQCDFGTDYVKPTRLLLSLGIHNKLFFEGPPAFTSAGHYTGPIPMSKGKRPLVRQRWETEFRTTGAAAWPPLMFKALAHALHTAWSNGKMTLNVVGDITLPLDQNTTAPETVTEL